MPSSSYNSFSLDKIMNEEKSNLLNEEKKAKKNYSPLFNWANVYFLIKKLNRNNYFLVFIFN